MAQTATRHISVNQIMRSADFQHGVADVRSGRSPRFDEFGTDWLYEWGRMYGVVAPRDLEVMLPKRKLNPRAANAFLDIL